jgi:hypothetical protein
MIRRDPFGQIGVLGFPTRRAGGSDDRTVGSDDRQIGRLTIVTWVPAVVVSMRSESVQARII